MNKTILKKHLLPATTWRSDGYIDTEKINQELSFYIQSRPRSVGGCYVYQFVVMNDGTTYELSSNTSSTRGIVVHNLRSTNVLQRDVKLLTRNAIQY